MNTATFEMVAKTFQGLEDVLAQEISNIGGNDIEVGRRMVAFTGDKRMLYKANLHCRTALRILKPIYKFKATNTDEVYEKVKGFDWDKYLDLGKTFSIESVVYSEDFKHSKFVTYRAKDAIVDYFTEKYEKRPSVRLNNADIVLNLHISHQVCTLSLDSSGESLHKRGYRVSQTEAPLNEVLAAGMILKSGWSGESNFVDPMCGSGTLLIEAAMIATNTAPGIYRKEFAFERWSDFDNDLFQELYNDDSQERVYEHRIYGSDISPKAVAIAEENIKSAGFSQYITLQNKSLQQYQESPKAGVLITNPPYGERITTDDLLGLYEMIGERLKHVFKGFSAWIISYREECFEKIGLKPSAKIDMMNGALECQYRKYEIFDGKYKEHKKEIAESGETKEQPEERTWKERKPYGNKIERGDRKPFGDRERGERKPFGDRERGDRKPFGDRERGDRKPFGDRERGDRKPFGDRERGDRKPFGDRERGERKPFGDRERGERKPFGDRERGERKPFGDRERGERKPFGDRERGERKPFGDRERGDRKPFGDRERGERKPFGDRERGERKPFGDRERGDRKPFGDRERGDRKPFGDRERGERKPFGDRERGDRKPFDKRASERGKSDEPFEFIHGEEAFNKFVNFRQPSIESEHAPARGMKMRERNNKRENNENED